MATTPTDSQKRLKACTNCTNAKTKCTPFGHLNNLCERCHRLGKHCSYAEATVRPKKNRLSSRKQLEDKVDSLVSLLQTIQPGAQTGSRSYAPPPPTQPSPVEPFANVETSGCSSDAGIGSLLSCPMEVHSRLAWDQVGAVLDDLPIEMTNQLFSTYCKEFAPEFPFVTFTPSETVSTMKIGRPLTLKSLLAVALCRDPGLQRKAGNEVTRAIKMRMMSRATYSFDLLEAILIHSVWYQYQFRPKGQEFFLMVQFAITLTHELGIDKSPNNRKMDLTLNELRPAAMEGIKYEQSRVLLGTYYVAAVFSQAFRKPKLMQYTRFMEKCRQRLLESIEMQMDYSIDIILAIHNVCMEVNETFNLYDFEHCDVSGDLAIKSLITGFMKELKAIEIRAQSRGSGALTPNEQRHLSYARVYVHEVAVHKDLWPSSDLQSKAISPTRIQLAWSGLELAKKLFSSYAHMPGDDLFKLTTAPWTQMLYSLIMLNKFVALDCADQAPDASLSGQWDVHLAYKEAEVQKLGTIIIEKIASRTSSETLEDGSRSIIWSLGWVIKKMMNGHQQWLTGCPPTNEGDTTIPYAPLLDNDSSTVQSTSVGESTPGMSGEGLSANTPFASAFPDVSFETAEWPEGIFNNMVWDTMMNDMNTLPFG